MKPHGTITIDAGASAALAKGKSLLPVGVTEVSGTFSRGDPVAIYSVSGEQIGVGLSRYSSVEAQAARGIHSKDIAKTLGYEGRSVVIHRDDMVI